MPDLLFYSISTVFAALLGAVIPNYFKWEKRFIQVFLAISAGIIFRIDVLHLIPEVYQHIGMQSLLFVQFGFILPLLIDYFFKSKSQETHSDSHSVINIITVSGFLVHSLLDGFVLNVDQLSHTTGNLTLLGIVLHKVPVSFSLFTLLKSHLKSRAIISTVFLLFVMFTPLGALLGSLIVSSSHLFLISAIGAFTSGLFLYIAFLHLFIDHELYKHRQLVLMTILGIVISLTLLLSL